MVLGHEITGEVIELGDDCEFLEVGDVCSVPFNIACGRCAACKRGDTGVCLNVNPARPGAAYGYVDMGGWIGGQSEYVMVPYADFNLLKFPDRAQVRVGHTLRCAHIIYYLRSNSVVLRDSHNMYIH
jgi:glutathione-independent formaldehyde dehydrogenase